MTITFIGHGYVGLVTAAVFADLGNTVWVIGHTQEKIDNLNNGILPIYEPGLEEIVKRNLEAKRLLFTRDYDKAIPESKVVFIAVGTPPLESGAADLSVVFDVAGKTAKYLKDYTVIVTKSTVPVGTHKKVKEIIQNAKNPEITFDIASVPEFLREGQAIGDTLHPDRIIIGTESNTAQDLLVELHGPLDGKRILTNIPTAEMIKYAANAALATKISFANAIAQLSEKLGADGVSVLEAVGLDKRVGNSFLQAGAGYGGSCFEANESVFALNSPNIAVERIDELFSNNGITFSGDFINFVIPNDKRVLAFDLDTGKSTLADVKAITKRQYKGKMVTIKSSMGRTLRVTSDHPVVLYEDEKFTIVPAERIIPGNHLLALCKLPKVEQKNSYDLLELLEGTPLELDVYVKPIDDSFTRLYKQYYRSVPKTMLKYPDGIKRYNRMSLVLYRYLNELGLIDIPSEKLQLYTSLGAGARINAHISVDSDLLRLCGYYLAEGYISKDNGRKNAVRERIGFSFHENETEYIHDAQRILQKLGLKFIERHSTHAITTLVSSRIFAWFLRDVLRCGTSSGNKSLPRMVFNVSPELRWELIRGAISGDGAVTPLQKGKNLMIEYATVSKSLSDGIVLLLQTVGIISSIRVRWMNKSTMVAYIIRINGHGQISLMKNIFGEKRRAQIETLLSGYQKHIHQHGFKRHGDFAALKVLETKIDDVETMVYSMETSTGTLITSSGLISHNCFPKDVKALIEIAKQTGYQFNLLQDVESINEQAMMGIVDKAKEMLGDVRGKTIGILGLAFKPNTDDMRDAPSIVIIKALQKQGAVIKAYDPIAMENAKRLVENVTLCPGAFEVAEGSDLVILVTEWNEFKELDLEEVKKRMKDKHFIDGRNIYDPEKMRSIGFNYRGVGR